MNTWQLQDAKARLSELINRTKTGPQIITRHDEPTAVIMSYEDYKKKMKPRSSLVRFMQESPLVGIKITRDNSKTRDADL